MASVMITASAFPAAESATSNTAATERTVFVTVPDNRGAPVADPPPADFVVKEGGKEREITKAQPATSPMRVALAIEEIMVRDTAVRQSVFDFMKRVANTAEISLITIGLRNTTIVDYTSNL